MQKKILEPVILEVDEIIHQALSCKSTQNCDSLARKTLALLERLRDEAKETARRGSRIKTRKTTQTIHLALRMNLIPKPMVTTRVKGMEIPKSKTMMLVMVKHLWKIMSRQSNLKGMKKVLKAVTVNLMESPETDESANPTLYDADGTPSQIDSSNGNPSDGESNFSPEQWSILAKLLDDFLNSDEESEDFHEALANEISVIAASVSDEVKAEFGANEWDLPDLLIDLNVDNEALNISQTLGADLSVLQQVKMRGQFKTRDRGLSFDINRLIQSPMGVRDVFRSQSESKNRGHVGLVIVRDISGSMILDHRYIHAIKTDLALTLAIEANSKMHVANVIYPFVDKDFEVIKTFDENAEETLSKFSLGCKGNNTPTGSALMAAVELLLESQFDRKIVFLITDGYPTESDYTISDVLTVAESNGIEIAGVGIKTWWCR
ncbi:VWA domain-containing protein [Enterobacter cloacae complex sp. 288G10]|uniref:VWA domain-containing protein n=1 Tax=Enterobacter cloacae complex sp. 288G10 TaxID=3395859 RepID=UPI003CF2D8E5